MEQKDSAERILKQIPYEIVYSARKTPVSYTHLDVYKRQDIQDHPEAWF